MSLLFVTVQAKYPAARTPVVTDAADADSNQSTHLSIAATIDGTSSSAAAPR